MAPAGTQDTNAAAIATPDDERVLLTEEEQAQRDANILRQAHEEADCKHNELAKKQHDAQAAQEKRKVDQHEADAKVRGRLLAIAAMAEVRRQYAHQADNVRKAVEKLCLEREALQSPWKVWMHLGVSFSSCLRCFRG